MRAAPLAHSTALVVAMSLSSITGCASAVNSDDGSHASDATTGTDALPRGDDWQGYIESYTFRSGSDHVRLVFDPASGDGTRTGSVILGEGAAPPAPTDPSMAYPPSFDFENPSLFVEGFHYPIATGRVSGSRVQATIELSAPWAAWCALQTPVAQDATGERYGCIPNGASSRTPAGCSITDANGHSVMVDCGAMYLCRDAHVCSCDATQCRAGSIEQVAFDFQRSGDRGDGTVTLPELRNVHLTRQ